MCALGCTAMVCAWAVEAAVMTWLALSGLSIISVTNALAAAHTNATSLSEWHLVPILVVAFQ